MLSIDEDADAAVEARVHNYYYYIHLTSFFPGQPGKPAPKW